MQFVVWLMVATAVGGPVAAAIGPVQARAVFSMNGVQGSILFEQDAPQAKSNVTLKLSGLIDKYGPNPWHIHEKPLPLPKNRSQQYDCGLAGGHFDADAGQPSRWDMGTMTSVHGEVDEQRVLTSGINVSLSGPDSIVGHSVVIHKAKSGSSLNAPRWVCANIEYVDPPITAWAVFNMDGVAGSIRFSQGTNGSDPTQIAVDLTGLENGPNPWHVHEKPVHGGECGDSSTGSHFMSESIWDLATKHGKLSGPVVRQRFVEKTWAGLPLFGPDSVVGKSIVIHKANNDRWVCATIALRPACHDDPSWTDDDPGGTSCASIAGKPLSCLQHNSQLRMTNCPRSCGYCPDQASSPDYSLIPNGMQRPSVISKGGYNWFHFTGEKGTSYEIVVTVIPGASNLQDSVLELYSRMPADKLIMMNDDAITHEGDHKNSNIRGDRGSKISWQCDQDGEYWIRVRAFSLQDHGYYTVHLTTVPQVDSCTDGKQNVGEEGVDCGGSCQPCHISIILALQQSRTNSGDLIRVDADSDGVPDFFQHLERDVKSALGNATYNRVEVKDVQISPHSVLVNVQLEAPAGLYQVINPDLVVKQLQTQINDRHSMFSIRQPDVQSASRGVLCPSLTAEANEPYLCWYGTCNTDAKTPAKCNCDSGYEGPHCHQRTIANHTPEREGGSASWVYPAIGCVVLSIVVLACWHRNRVEKRKYNQTVFEMLQADVAGPNSGFGQTTPGGVLKTVSQGQNGMTPQQLNYDTAASYTPNQTYVTGGF
eukprot:COSAG02_NODE_1177_length_14052_cov_5.923171_3_plen_763_part_00